jgi:hypothetical protein
MKIVLKEYSELSEIPINIKSDLIKSLKILRLMPDTLFLDTRTKHN